MKRKSAKILSVILAAVVLLSLLPACAAGEDDAQASTPAGTAAPAETPAAAEDITLTFWHTYSEGEAEILLNELIPAFEAANPGITIDPVTMPLDGLQEQVVTAVAGDAAPDVMRMDITWVAQFAKMGALVPLSGLDGFDAIKENSLYAPMETNFYNGDYYGLPLDTNTTTAVWNMDLLQELGVSTPPATIDELVALAETANDAANEKWVFTIAGTYTWAMLPWFWSLGGTLTNDDYTTSTGYLNSAKSVEALNTIAGWYADGIISPAIIGEEPGAWNGMTGGNYAMISEGPWFFSSADTAFESAATVMPSGAGGSISVVGGEDLVMLSKTKHQEAAWKFMTYMMSDEVQLAMTGAGFIPTTHTAMDKMDTSQTPYLQAYLDQLETALPRIPSPNYTQIDELLGDAFEQVIRGEMTAQEALDGAAAQVDALLKN